MSDFWQGFLLGAFALFALAGIVVGIKVWFDDRDAWL